MLRYSSSYKAECSFDVDRNILYTCLYIFVYIYINVYLEKSLKIYAKNKCRILGPHGKSIESEASFL